jgi:hypothetical protein
LYIGFIFHKQKAHDAILVQCFCTFTLRLTGRSLGR